MKGYAKVVIMGNLTADPEKRAINSESGEITKVEFTIAVNEREDEVQFLRCEAWGKLADIICMASKGEPVFVEGNVDQQTYQDKEGNNRTITKFRAREFRFLGGKKEE